MVARSSLILFLILLTAGCRPATPAATPVVATASPASTSLTPGVPTRGPALPGLTAEQIKNADYQLGATDVPRTIQLVNGAYQEGTPGGADFVEVQLTDFIALGDLDGDGIGEAAALVSENYGGSGVFVFLALYAQQNNKPAFQASVFVDDRPQITGLSIEKGEVSLDAIIHKQDEPMCCPTLQTRRHYRLVNDQLDMTDYVTFTPEGKPRTIQIESPDDGAQVLSFVQVKGTVAIAPFENTLAYTIKDGAGVELARGSITVSAAQAGGPGSFDAVIPFGNILSNTVVTLELQDISAADGSLLAMDSLLLVVK